MTKVTPISINHRLNTLQSRYRSLCSEVFQNPENSGSPSSDDDGDFQIHRRMLRRRHVRKEQKELSRRRKEHEEQKWRRMVGQTTNDNGESAVSAADTESAPCSPSTGRVVTVENPHSHPMRHPTSTTSPPPPQTVAYQCWESPLRNEPLVLARGGLVPTFSPLRSRKRRSIRF